MLSVIMLECRYAESLYGQSPYAECHYDDSLYAKCFGAVLRTGSFGNCFQENKFIFVLERDLQGNQYK
jgi:hypothetical protein